MAKRGADGKLIIAAGEVSAFSVCPQAWHLKWNKRALKPNISSSSELGQKLHEDWSSFFEESLRLAKRVRWLAALVCLMIVVFITISSTHTPLNHLFQFSWRNLGLQLIVLVLVSLWVIHLFIREAKRRHKDSGFSPTQITLSIDGGSLLQEREYISPNQGLAGKPDALINEGGEIIPVERKPLAKKLRDRYVAQLLVYMRLVEEFEGVRPSHGYLLLGPSCRRIKVVNSESKQKWVDGLLREMRRILDGGEPTATPHPIKCSKCDVKHQCSARMDERNPS